MFRHACAFVLFVCLAPCAFAQDGSPKAALGAPALVAIDTTAPLLAAAAAVSPDAVKDAARPAGPDAASQPPVVVPRTIATSHRPAALVPMYVSFAALQAMDFHSTTRALSSGAGTEANPVMAGIVGNRAAFVAMKAVSAASTIWLGEMLWKKHHPVAAIALTAIANGALAVIVAHNYSVTR